MPELPEVETIRRGLELVLPCKEIKQVLINYEGAIKTPAAKEFARGLVGRTFCAAGRRGKYLLLYLDDESVLVVHLRMTGRLVYTETEPDADKHTHVILRLSDGAWLHFNDVRKFGGFWWVPCDRLGEIRGLSTLGPEPLSAEFHFPYLDRELERRTVNIKALLLDQTFVAGLGNIYADEILHRCHIRPDRKARSLGRAERLSLFAAVRQVLDEAIAWRGTTFNDYRDAAGQSGAFQNRLNVYQRHNESCPECGGLIERHVVAGRGTHFCPGCQR